MGCATSSVPSSWNDGTSQAEQAMREAQNNPQSPMRKQRMPASRRKYEVSLGYVQRVTPATRTSGLAAGRAAASLVAAPSAERAARPLTHPAITSFLDALLPQSFSLNDGENDFFEYVPVR